MRQTNRGQGNRGQGNRGQGNRGQRKRGQQNRGQRNRGQRNRGQQRGRGHGRLVAEENSEERRAQHEEQLQVIINSI